uniref:Uncharacterized protein n=1 Tax=Rhizophora mucronata TaxID=61149 RepID=A0A2P2PJR6_RHIMU
MVWMILSLDISTQIVFILPKTSMCMAFMIVEQEAAMRNLHAVTLGMAWAW